MGTAKVTDVDDLSEIFTAAGLRMGAITCLPLEEVRKSRSAMAGRPIRSSRHAVIVLTSGSGTHIVDSAGYGLELGHVAHILPGQMQRFLPDQNLNGWLLSIDRWCARQGFLISHVRRRSCNWGHR